MAIWGYYSLYSAFVFSLLWILFSLVGILKKDIRYSESAKRSAYITFIFITFSSLSLLYALITKDFSIEYVAKHTSSSLPLIYRFTAFWAGMEGSLLLWTQVLAIFSVLLIYENRRYRDYLSQWIFLFSGLVFLFFITLVAFLSNPLKTLPYRPPDGRGMNPLLQNISMAIHPVALYLGYVGFAVPFVYAMAALASGDTDADWLQRTKRWTLLSWIFLTLGIFLGARWAYVELGWGGYWGWDPVENASLIPWLTATALLHSMILVEMRNILRRWSFILVILTFELIILGAYITRSGVVSSVHAYVNSNLSIFFLLYLSGWAVLGVFLLAIRWKKLRGEELRNITSKEGFFVLNNWLFVGLAFSVLFGVFLPLLSKLITGAKITAGPHFFNSMSVPFFMLILVILAICPFLAWRRFSVRVMKRGLLIPFVFSLLVATLLVTFGIRHKVALTAYSLAAFVITGTFYDIIKSIFIHSKISKIGFLSSLVSIFRQNQQKYGGYIVHMGIAMIAIGITASSTFQIKKEVNLNVGQSVKVGGFRVTYEGINSGNGGGMEYVRANLKLSRDSGKRLGLLHPEIRNYRDWPGQTAEVDLQPLWEGDFYATLLDWDKDGNALLDLYFNPLVQWIWIGALVMIIGGLIAFLPIKKRKRKYGLDSGTEKRGI